MRKFLFITASQLLMTGAFAQKEGVEIFINRLKEDGMKASQVINHGFYLTHVSGPRLTVSPGFMNAAVWAKNKLESWD